MSHTHDESSCSCHKSSTSVTQTLDELDFERGIWSAALSGDLDGVKKFLTKGCDPNVCDKSGYTALHYSSRNGHLNVSQLLLNSGADANIQTRSGQGTALQRAAYMGHVEVVQLLLKSGARVGLQDADGQTALHKAASRSHGAVCKLLLTACKDLASILDKRGRKAVDLVPSEDVELHSLLECE